MNDSSGNAPWWQNKTVQLIALIVVLIVLGSIYLRFELPVVSVAAEKLPGWGGITNSLLTSWVVIIIIGVVAYLGTRHMALIPSGLQNVLEFMIETLYNLTESVAGSKWAPKFFMVPATIFIYVLVSNWIGLFPGLMGVGICAPHHYETHAEASHGEDDAHDSNEDHAKEEDAHSDDNKDDAHAEDDAHVAESSGGFMVGTTCDEGEHIIPFFRSPSADLNNTLMLALVTQFMAQFFGITALTGAGYASKFFIIDGIKAAFEPDADGNPKPRGSMIGELVMGLINFFVGVLELLSEFIKVIAFTFRLFGNIFAGEVMLIVLTFLVPLLLTIPFIGFEIFVGLVQAFIFFILSVAFYSVAVTSHDHDHEDGHH